jgi:hypothetical protein
VVVIVIVIVIVVVIEAVMVRSWPIGINSARR